MSEKIKDFNNAKSKLVDSASRGLKRVLEPTSPPLWEQNVRKAILLGAQRKSISPCVNGVVSQNPLTHMSLEGLLRITAPEMNLLGKSACNAQKVRNLIQDGAAIIEMSNHLSHADGMTNDQMLRRNGFTDLAEKLVYPRGIRLEKFKAVELLTHSLPIFRVWPPNIKPEGRNERKEFLEINREAKKSAEALLSKGYNLTLFPEAQRSPNGKLQEFYPSIAEYLFMTSVPTYVWPKAHWGQESILPYKKASIKPHIVCANYGEPVLIDDYLKKYGNLSHNQRNTAIMNEIRESMKKLLPAKYK